MKPSIHTKRASTKPQREAGVQRERWQADILRGGFTDETKHTWETTN